MSDSKQKLQGLKIFISYPRGGYAHSWAEKLEHWLTEKHAAVAWRDEQSIDAGNPDFVTELERGVVEADLLLCLVTDDTAGSDWVKRELLTALRFKKPIIAVRLEAVPMPYLLAERQPIDHENDDAATLTKLNAAIVKVQLNLQANTVFETRPSNTLSDTSPQRHCELQWLDNLLYQRYSKHAQRYVPIEGKAKKTLSLSRAVESTPIETDAILKAFGQSKASHGQAEEQCYTDVLDAYRNLPQQKVRRLAVLGDPGAGKSFSLERIAQEYASRAIEDIDAPIPILIQLGRWTREAETLEAFVIRMSEALGRFFPNIREQKRLVLLLDGMNEIPPGQRRNKAEQIKILAGDARFQSVIVSCREKDFSGDLNLPFDTLTLQPLTAVQIYDFLQRVYSLLDDANASARADQRFWQIAGGEKVRQAYELWKNSGATLCDFWEEDGIPEKVFDSYGHPFFQENEVRKFSRSNKRSLIKLASNPYLLYIMSELPHLPETRAEMFKGFLDLLYNAEKQRREKRHDQQSVPLYEDWLATLQQFAKALQNAKCGADDDGAQTALPREAWPKALSEDLIDFSRDASVLQLAGDDLRFTHQLLQEYLASQLLLDLALQNNESANAIWPADRWWEPLLYRCS